MAISTYIDPKSGATLFKVQISRSSSTQPGVSIDKRAQGFKTKIEAERAEKKLFIQVERELMEAESRSCKWAALIDEWELAARAGDIFIRDLSVGTIRDYVDILREQTHDWMKLHASEIDRARAWMVLDRIEREISISRRKRLRTAIDAQRRREDARDFKSRSDQNSSFLREKCEPPLVSDLGVGSFHWDAIRRTLRARMGSNRL